MDPEYLYLFLKIIIPVWFLSFFYNLIYFYNKKELDIDRIFLNKTKTFEESLSDLELLEDFVGKKLDQARAMILKYQNNALRTKRKYSYYSSYIEPGFLKIYLNQNNSFKDCLKLIDKPIKIHFFLIVGLFMIIAVSIVLFLLILTILNFSLSLFFFLLIAIILIAKFYTIIIHFLYILLDSVLYIFGRQRGSLNRNIDLLDYCMRSFGIHDRGGMLITAGAVTSFSSGSGGGFGGFGGGSFGGGGAGGSW